MTRAYFNKKAANWDETASERDTTKLEHMSRRLNIKPASTILDVGTGTGVFIPFLLKIIGSRGQIVYLDIAEKMLAKARAKGFYGNVAYLCADITNIPIDNDIFDSVVCYSTFPHFQDKPSALTEMARVIKINGKLLICHTTSRIKLNDIHHQIPEVENDSIPDEAEMRAMLSEVGFTNIMIDDNNESYFCSAIKLNLKQF
jgi:ubiquinone/menaquinone biosynthesis C-methylase UbiE